MRTAPGTPRTRPSAHTLLLLQRPHCPIFFSGQYFVKSSGARPYTIISSAGHAAVGILRKPATRSLDLVPVQLVRQGDCVLAPELRDSCLTACRIDDVEGVVRHERVGLPDSG